MNPINEKSKIWRLENYSGVYLFKADIKNFVYNKHTHDEYAFGIIEKGGHRFFYKGSYTTAYPDSVVTVNPDVVHDGRASGDQACKYRMIYINPKIITEFLNEYFLVNERLLFFRNPINYDKHLYAGLKKALYNLEYFPHLMSSEDSLATILQNIFSRYSEKSIECKQSRNQNIASQSIQYIKDNAKENINLESISNAVGLSRFHFLRVFKDTVGISPHKFVVQHRLKIAKDMLNNGVNLSIAAIESGFSDQSHFTRLFKQAYGVTPGQYKIITV